MQKHMIAKDRFTYAGARLIPGDKFTATESDARLLAIAGKAQVQEPPARVNARQPSKAPGGKAREPKQEPQSGIGPDAGRYARRDLRAES